MSGGLDSTHALIVAARAMDLLGVPRTNVLGYTMPGFATSDATKSNAWALMRALGVSRERARHPGQPPGSCWPTWSIRSARGEEVYDVTFENVQAGLRTDYLFRLANHHGGIVLGTGDLSELALGWCTYGVGDQMSHYNVNGGVPKTLIQHLIRFVAGLEDFSDDVDEILLSILDTEISPELIPVKEGEAPQSTEKSIGPYELQDFTLYYTLRFGLRPSKIAFLAWHAWHDIAAGEWPAGFPEERRRAYDLPAIRKWLLVFVRRFFAFSQFKRSALPNGPKVSAGGSLSPRGDWRAPSDGNAAVWLADIERNVPESLTAPAVCARRDQLVSGRAAAATLVDRPRHLRPARRDPLTVHQEHLDRMPVDQGGVVADPQPEEPQQGVVAVDARAASGPQGRTPGPGPFRTRPSDRAGRSPGS